MTSSDFSQTPGVSEVPATPVSSGSSIRIGSLIWGVMVIVLSVLLCITKYTVWDLDPRLVLIGAVALGGLALVIGGVLSAVSKRSPAPPGQKSSLP
ncbi:hypothetical protein [Psychromicrobium xiongbiense]|uniref:hypothetical protein n=1 Tax=Psychromicrobium xiongbiense TaxID=3051184 RepID=UPI002554282D|nr:hypothetical protein [Psychromicrobium sp. YIM S02556]